MVSDECKSEFGIARINTQTSQMRMVETDDFKLRTKIYSV